MSALLFVGCVVGYTVGAVVTYGIGDALGVDEDVDLPPIEAVAVFWPVTLVALLLSKVLRPPLRLLGRAADALASGSSSATRWVLERRERRRLPEARDVSERR